MSRQWRRPLVIPMRPVGVKPGAHAALSAYLDPYMSRVTAAEPGLAIPPVQTRVYRVPLTEPQRAAYPHAQVFGGGRDEVCRVADGRSGKAEAAAWWVVDNPQVRKVLIWAENHDLLDVTASNLDRVGVTWERLDGHVAVSDRGQIISRFQQPDGPRVLLGTSVLERGINGLAECCWVVISLGSTWSPARTRQITGRLARIGQTAAQVLHVVFLADVAHDTDRWDKHMARHLDSVTVMNGISA